MDDYDESESIYGESDESDFGATAAKRGRKPQPKVTGDWTDADADLLITQIELFSCLWDESCDDKRNLDCRVSAWQAVAESFENRFTPIQCTAKWQSLRASHRKEAGKMNMKKSGQCAVQMSNWKHFDSMSFLIASPSHNIFGESDESESVTTSPSAKAPKRRRKPQPRVTGDWTDADIELLITQIEMFSCLWDESSDHKRNLDCRVSAWQAVADSFQNRFTPIQCTAKWQSLRASQRNEAAKLKSKKSGQGAVQMSKWKHFDSMSFVLASKTSIAHPSSSSGRLSSSCSSGIDITNNVHRKRKNLATSILVPNRPTKVSIETHKAMETLENVATKYTLADEWQNVGDHIAAELRSLPYGQAKDLSRKMTRFMLDYLDANCSPQAMQKYGK